MTFDHSSADCFNCRIYELEKAYFQPNFVFALSMTEPDLRQVIAYKKSCMY